MKRIVLWLFPMIALAVAPWSAAQASNVEYSFNSKLEGWTFDSSAPGSLYWEWQKQTSSTEGALHAWIGSPSPAPLAMAWALSPLFEISQQGNPTPQPYVHVDFSHWTDFPVSGATSSIDPLALGQVQFQFMRTTDTSWSDWLAAPMLWSGTSQGHHPPNYGPPSLPPLIENGGSFAGRSPDFDNHVTSMFDIDWNAFTPALGNGDLIQFRFMAGITGELPSAQTPQIVWELNSVGIDGVREVPVPEIDPAGIGSVLALVTGALGLVERRRRA